MALTRALLKAFNLTDEQISTIIEAHTDTIKGLQDSLKAAEEQAAKYETVKKEFDELKKANAEDYKTKYETEKKAFDEYKNEISAKETKAAKEKAVSAYFESKGITGKNLAIAMRGCKSELDGIELDGEKIKDKAILDELIKGDFSGLVSTTKIKGATTANPPANTGGRMTKEQIFAIKDDAARQTAIAENHDLFGF